MKFHFAQKKKSYVQDMTVGDPFKLLFAFAVPLLIGNVIQRLYTMADTVIVGRYIGSYAISAIGATASLYGLLMNFAGNMNHGFAIITTQAFGSHDETRMRRSIAGMFILDALVSVVLISLTILFMRPLLRFMNTPAGIFEDTYNYIFVLCIGSFATLAYNMFAGILRAVGNSKTPLYYLTLASVLNVVLDVVFIVVFHMGVIGAALATVLSQAVSAVCCGFTFFRNYRSMIPSRDDYVKSRAMWPELLSSGMAMAMMMCVVNLGSVIYQRANNMLGEAMIAAYASAHKVVLLFMQPAGALVTAVSTFVSQNWGARNLDRIKSTLRKSMVWIVLIELACVAIVYLSGDLLIRFITGADDAEVLANGVLALRLSVSFFPFLGVLLCLRSSMQAMGYKAAPVASSFVELAIKIFGAIVLIPSFGFLGSCLTEPVSWPAMTIFLIIAYLIQRKKIYAEDPK